MDDRTKFMSVVLPEVSLGSQILQGKLKLDILTG